MLEKCVIILAPGLQMNIGLYRDVWIAAIIQDEVGDSIRGNV